MSGHPSILPHRPGWLAVPGCGLASLHAPRWGGHLAGQRRLHRFHQAMGFTVTGPVPGYNGPGRDRIVFSRSR